VPKTHPPASRSLAQMLSRLTRLIVAWSVVVALAWGPVARGQAPFSPPPPPKITPAQQQSQPTAQPVAVAPATASPVTPTFSNGIQPLEGGQIIARVDGQIVLASDVLWQVDQLIEANRDRIPSEEVEQAKQMLLRQQVMGLIDTKILYANFRRQVPAEGIPQIEENLRKPFEENEIPRLVKMLKLENRSELDALLRKSGASLANVQRQFNEKTIAGEWLRQMIPKPKEATHEDMLAYYHEHKKEYEYPAQVKWEEVLIRFDRVGGDRTQAWQAITGLGNDVWQRVLQQPGLRGPVFTEIAAQKSHGFTAQEGGQHDWTTKGALKSEEINQALFSLQVGQLSNAIESEFGFHIVRVLERKEAGCTPFTEAQKTIRKALGKNQQQGLAQAEIAKLRKKSRVWTLFDGEISGSELSRKLSSTKRR